jgi:AcrR family transcriptional regulator
MEKYAARKSIDDHLHTDASSAAGQKSRTKRVQKKYTARYIQILEAAARQFSKKGYHVATTKDIAEELGIQQGSLYYYIKSKEAALEQICLVAIEGYVAFSEEIRRSRRSPRQKVQDVVAHHLRTIQDRPEFFKVFMNHRHGLREEVRREIGRQTREYEKNIEAIIRQGVRKGEFRSAIDCAHATLALLGMCNFVAVWWGKRSNTTVPQISQEFADLLIEGLAGKTD